MKKEPTLLAWIDLETTGLDKDYDQIVEVALVVTDMAFNVVSRPFQSVVMPYGGKTTLEVLALIEANEHVNKMHTESGLKAAIRDGQGMGLMTVLDECIAVLEECGEKKDYMIAGSGVARFDMAWIEMILPELMEWLDYAPYDIGVIRRHVKYVLGRPDILPEERKIHRSMDDVEDFIDQARVIRERLIIPYA